MPLDLPHRLSSARATVIRPTDGYVRLGFHSAPDDTIYSGLAHTVGGSAMLIWQVLKARAIHETGVTEISYRGLMRSTGFSRDTIWRKLAALERHGLLRRVPGLSRQRGRYVARELIAVRHGDDEEIIAALVFDYVPRFAERNRKILKAAFSRQAPLPDWLTVWPAPGYMYDARSGLLYRRSAPPEPLRTA